MYDYIKHTLRYSLSLHTGTNDLHSNKPSSDIAQEIVKLATDIQIDDMEVLIHKEEVIRKE